MSSHRINNPVVMFNSMLNVATERHIYQVGSLRRKMELEIRLWHKKVNSDNYRIWESIGGRRSWAGYCIFRTEKGLVQEIWGKGEDSMSSPSYISEWQDFLNSRTLHTYSTDKLPLIIECSFFWKVGVGA